MTSSIEVYSQRLKDIRALMEKEKIDAFITPCADQYQVEYLGPDVQRLRWLTGFTGEAAITVVLKDKAAIFVDGRFTVQVRQQVPPTLFDYHHLVEEPHLDWLKSALKPGDKLGFDATLQTYNWYKEAKATFKDTGIDLQQLAENPIDTLWQDRPKAVKTPGLLLEETYSGCSCLKKRQLLAEKLVQTDADSLVLTQPDSINWLFNIRGNDVPCLPVVLGYAIVHKNSDAEIFVPEGKLDTRFLPHAGDGVTLNRLNQLEKTLIQLGEAGSIIQIDTHHTNAWIPLTLENNGAEIKHAEDPCMLLKAVKNETEIAGMRQAHIYAGIATCRFLAWLDRKVVDDKDSLDEGVLADKLESLLEEHPRYHGCSFDTISAIGPNAAMCHYNHALVTPRKMGQDGMYLIDSGAQYPEGTTDMTRTIKIGEVTEEMRIRYTQVLQGHIKLAMARFPHSTKGIQLDCLARMPLWQDNCDYDHGTGHGVGHFLSVHESPARFSTRETQSYMLPGMMITIEPGYYKADSYGLRIENLYLVKPVDSSKEKGFLKMESLTFVPIDCRLIQKELLSEEEIRWLDNYHLQVKTMMSPHLAGQDLDWLESVTQPLADQLI